MQWPDRRLAVSAALSALLSSPWLMAGAEPCGSLSSSSETLPPGRPLEEAERLFRQDPRWLGSDGAASADLGDGRVFWTFEDSFVAPVAGQPRSAAIMVRNSIAVQTGPDPRTATMEFLWGEGAGGEPGDYFPGTEEYWYWTGGALRLDRGPLIVFLKRMRATPGLGLGFSEAGFAVAVIEDPDRPPAQWRPRIHHGPAIPFDALPATALVLEEGWVVGLALAFGGDHAGRLVRYRPEELVRGDLSRAQWWSGDDPGWVPMHSLGPEGAAIVIDSAGAEASLHFEPRLGRWVHVATYGFGDAWIGLRSAARLTGPWPDPRPVYLPPEGCLDRPFIYGAFAHPELTAPRPGELLITYATNSFDFGELLVPPGSERLYWPRVIRIDPRLLGIPETR